MGACGSDSINKLGPEFGKFVAAEKGKVLIDQKAKEFKDAVFRESDRTKSQTLSKINQQQKLVLQKVKSTIAEIDKQSPGTLDKSAALQRKTKENMLGADDIRSKFNQLRLSTENQFQQEERKIANQIQSLAQQQKSVLQSQSPNVPLYNQLSDSQKRKAFQEGQKRYADQIKSQQDQLNKHIQSQFDMTKFQQYLSGVQSTVNIEGISHQATSLITAAKSGLGVTSAFC